MNTCQNCGTPSPRCSRRDNKWLCPTCASHFDDLGGFTEAFHRRTS